MGAVVIISDGCCLRIEAHGSYLSNQPNKNKLWLCIAVTFTLKTAVHKMQGQSASVTYKGGCCVHECMHIKVFERRAVQATGK